MPSGALAHRMFGLKHSADLLIGPAECTLLSFQRPLRLRDVIRLSQTPGPHKGAPEGE